MRKRKYYLRLTNTERHVILQCLLEYRNKLISQGKYTDGVDELIQFVLLDAINLNDCTPSHAQSIRLKKLSQEGLLDQNAIYEIMSEEKPNQQEQIKLKREDFRNYFPPNYTDEQIKKDIVKGLELLKRQRDRNRDAR